jgi:hypothetical protein
VGRWRFADGGEFSTAAVRAYYEPTAAMGSAACTNDLIYAFTASMDPIGTHCDC